jgi:hypothetical protein
VAAGFVEPRKSRSEGNSGTEKIVGPSISIHPEIPSEFVPFPLCLHLAADVFSQSQFPLNPTSDAVFSRS